MIAKIKQQFSVFFLVSSDVYIWLKSKNCIIKSRTFFYILTRFIFFYGLEISMVNIVRVATCIVRTFFFRLPINELNESYTELVNIL